VEVFVFLENLHFRKATKSCKKTTKKFEKVGANVGFFLCESSKLSIRVDGRRESDPFKLEYALVLNKTYPHQLLEIKRGFTMPAIITL
jgi:hypothetical protein